MAQVRPLNLKLQALAAKEINEDPRRLVDDLQTVKTWLTKQPHLHSRTDDQFLVGFLRGSKFSIERTKEKLDMYYTLRTVTPELFTNRDPMQPDIQKLLSLGVMLPLPKLASEDGPRYTLVRSGLVDITEIHQSVLFKLCNMIQDILLMEDDNFAISGGVALQDMGDITMKFSLTLSPALVKKTMTCVQKGYPSRIKDITFFNTSSVFEIIHKLFRPLLSEKLQNRIHIYSSVEELRKNVPKEVLPEEYGGDGGRLADITADWKKKVESYRDWFADDERYKSNEQCRPGQPKTSESVFGIDGSFRKLNVD